MKKGVAKIASPSESVIVLTGQWLTIKGTPVPVADARARWASQLGGLNLGDGSGARTQRLMFLEAAFRISGGGGGYSASMLIPFLVASPNSSSGRLSTD